MLHLIAEVAAQDVEQRSTVDVGCAGELTHVPPAAGLVLHFLLSEGVGLVGKVAAENDPVGPDIADDVGGRIGGQRTDERLAERTPLHQLRQEGLARTRPLALKPAPRALELGHWTTSGGLLGAGLPGED